LSRRHATAERGAVETGVVVDLNHDGQGVLHAGKAAFVAGALPGETIRFRRTRRHRHHDEGQLEELISSAPARVQPRCAHFAICGGCALQHLEHGEQLRLKQRQLRETLERLAHIAPGRWLEPLFALPWGYRRRARLGVKYVARRGRVLVGFRERASNLIACLERCEILAAPLDGLIEPLSALIGKLSIRERLPQIEVAIGDDCVALVLRVLSNPTAEDLCLLEQFEAQHGIRLWLQSGGLESVRALREPAPRLFYALPEADIELDFGPTDFIQVNAAVNRQLVAAAAQLLELNDQSRVLDLYCGLGNFSLALARRAQAVVGIEGDAGLITRARANAQRNGIANAQFFQADLAGPGLADASWLREPYTHILLDPPRIGARELLPQLARLAPQRLLYVSCHPGSLARDLGLLVHEYGFELLAAGVVDMFAHTAHVESLALLARAR
jgi:23S rRNA (uracil1939-C5)-methyltransferase